MNNTLSSDDTNLLYWHAVSKMQQGNFVGALVLFIYLYDKKPCFYHGMSAAYCALRTDQKDYAQKMLLQLTPSDSIQTRLLNRLERRSRL